MMFDYLIVGAGLFGSIFAHEANKRNRSCLVVEKRSHIGGNIYTRNQEGIMVHEYGAHIFHTSNEIVWNYIQQFAVFNHFVNSPIANYKGKLYNLPFNMNTFYQIWGVKTPAEAMSKIAEQRAEAGIVKPKNLEEQAISLVGKDIYEILIKGYTEKQWGRRCKDLPASIIRRLPVRFTFDNNYFRDPYQGIPNVGYTTIIERLLAGIPVRLNTDFLEHRDELSRIAKKIIFTGPIDAYFDYQFGPLEYRSVRFEIETLDIANYQGVAVVNYTERDIPYTRIIEHKHFAFGEQPFTVISREYPSEWHVGVEPYYPVNNEKNNALYEQYHALSKQFPNVHFAGRLGQYKYFDMDKTIAEALAFVDQEFPS